MLTVILLDKVGQVLSSKVSEPGLVGSYANCFLPEWPLILPGRKHLHFGGQQAKEAREGVTAGICTSPLSNQGEKEFLNLTCKLMQNHM